MLVGEKQGNGEHTRDQLCSCVLSCRGVFHLLYPRGQKKFSPAKRLHWYKQQTSVQYSSTADISSSISRKVSPNTCGRYVARAQLNDLSQLPTAFGFSVNARRACESYSQVVLTVGIKRPSSDRRAHLLRKNKSYAQSTQSAPLVCAWSRVQNS